MCYDADAAPPALDPPVTAVEAAPITLTGADGARFAAFSARPADPTGPGVLVLPDNRGLSGFYEQLTIRLAEQGHPAVAIDYFGRSAGVDYRSRGTFDPMPHLAALTKPGLYGDFAAGIGYLGGSVVALGCCLGGRFAFLTADRRFGLAGAIGLYGYSDPLRGAPGPTQLAADLTGPILALWGGADDGIPPPVVDAFAAALAAAGVPHEFVTYPGAPHGFFEAGRPGYADARADVWRRILRFLRSVA
jgi:carboxymethylenebutenolidase